jgi:hypothetical protein
VSVEYTGADANNIINGGCWGCLEKVIEVTILIVFGVAIYYGMN